MERQLPSPMISDAASPLEQMPQVRVHLRDVNAQEQYPDRILTLTAPGWSAKVGRGSQSEIELIPAPDNAWFTSRVMSRNHAIIRADPQERTVTIQDIGSMHGTSISGTKVRQEQCEIILDDDVVTFGAEVVRGPEKYQPLRLAVSYVWSDAAVVGWDANLAQNMSLNTTNRFTADYSDEEDCQSIANSDDVEVVGESVRQASVEFISAKPSSPFLSSVKSIDSPASEKHRSSPTEPTDVSDTEQTVLKKTPIVDTVSIPSMLNPNSMPEVLPTSADDDDASNMWDDQIDDYDVYDDDVRDEYEEANVRAKVSEIYPRYSTNALKDGANTGLVEQEVETTFPPMEESAPRDPSPSDAALPKATSAQRPKAVQYTIPTALQPPQSSSSLLPPPPSVSIPSLTSVYDTVNSHASNLTSSGVNAIPYSATGSNNGYGLTNLWTDQYPMCSPFTTSTHGLMGTNSLPPLGEPYNNDSQFRSPAADASHDLYENDRSARKRTLDDVYSNSKQFSPLSYSAFPAYQSGQPTQCFSADEALTTSAIAPREPAFTDTAPADRHLHTAAPKPMEDSKDRTTISANESSTDIEERPRKMRKTQAPVDQPVNNGSGFVKYAATALAGAAIGAVGTVLGLAALPVDFFA